jgi:predicted PurR-regulated permease PerM
MCCCCVGVGMGAVLADQVDGAAEQLPGWIDKLNAFTQEQFDTTWCRPPAPPSRGRRPAGHRVSAGARRRPAGAAGSLVGAVLSLFTVGLFTFYLTANGPRVRRVLLSRMPPERQRRVLWAWNTAIEKTGGCSSGWWPRSFPLSAPTSQGAVPVLVALAAVGGFIGAFFALPIAAVIQAFLSTYPRRYDVLESDLTRVDGPKLS